MTTSPRNGGDSTPRSAAKGPSPDQRADALLNLDPGLWAPRLTRILDRQRDLYAQLEALARTQSQCIEDDDSDALMNILAQRQGVVDEVVRLNDEVAPFARRWDELAPRLGPQQRDALRRRFDEVARLVDAIRTRDDADKRALESRRRSIAGELQSLARARGAASAYARPQDDGPHFQDQTG